MKLHTCRRAATVLLDKRAQKFQFTNVKESEFAFEDARDVREKASKLATG